MATTTTNFGWDIPQSTDLVKDGATAIATLGQDIDTSMVDLKGGTSGQILSKASNTDMDFTWVSPNPGDITGVTAGTGLTGGGTSGDVTVSFDIANYGGGQKAAGKNAVINGGFDIWQRGTSIAIPSSTVTYNADRWSAYRTATGCTISRQATNDTTNLPNIQYCARIQRDSGNTSTASIGYYNVFESVNSIPFAGKTVTVSFYARAGANLSAQPQYVVLKTGTGTDQSLYSGFTGAVNAVLSGITLTTTWQRFTYTATLNSNITQIGFGFEWPPTGTAGANDYFEITGVQLELGSVATPFSRNGSSIQGELAACQRYYFRSTAGTNYTVFGIGNALSTTGAMMQLKFPVTMRTRPTAIEYGGTIQLFDGVTATNITSATINTDLVTSTDLANFRATVASGLTQYRPYQIAAAADATAYFGFSAEL